MYTLTDIVNAYLIEEGEDSKHKTPMYLDVAIRGLKDLEWDVSGKPQVAILETDHLNRAQLPSDLINVMRLGFIDRNKNIVEIFKNTDILVNYDQVFNCSSNQFSSPTIKSREDRLYAYPSISFPSHYRNGELTGGYFGNVGGGRYEYNIDYNTGIVEFSTNVNGKIVLEYLGNPKTINGKYQVHPFLEEPLLNWIDWTTKRRKSNVSGGEVERLKGQYYVSKHNARVRFATESLGNLINAKRKSMSQSAKY